MNRQASLETAVRGILGDVLNRPPESLGNDDALAAFGWDSLASLEALAQLESHLGITLDLRSFHAARTVGDMVELVAKVVADRP